MIIEDTARFPDDEWSSDVSRESALGTKEIRNWTYSAYGSMSMYGSLHILWLANILLDNEGGSLHTLFTRVRQLMVIAPVISVIQAIKVNTAYARNYEWYDYGIDGNGADVGADDVDPS
mgnify:CR=1 FL=1